MNFKATLASAVFRALSPQGISEARQEISKLFLNNTLQKYAEVC